MNYMDKGVIRELGDDLIMRAANGEEKALEWILEIFDPYITAISSFDRVYPGCTRADRSQFMPALTVIKRGIPHWNDILKVF